MTLDLSGRLFLLFKHGNTLRRSWSEIISKLMALPTCLRSSFRLAISKALFSLLSVTGTTAVTRGLAADGLLVASQSPESSQAVS